MTEKGQFLAISPKKPGRVGIAHHLNSMSTPNPTLKRSCAKSAQPVIATHKAKKDKKTVRHG